MGLRKFEVMVRQNSTVTMDYLIVKYKRIMNEFMLKPENIKSDGSFLFVWYAEIFDSRTNKTYKVFCDYATNLYNIENEYICEDGTIIKGVIYLSAIIDELEELKIEIAFLKAELYNTETTNNNTDLQVKILT